MPEQWFPEWEELAPPEHLLELAQDLFCEDEEAEEGAGNGLTFSPSSSKPSEERPHPFARASSSLNVRDGTATRAFFRPDEHQEEEATQVKTMPMEQLIVGIDKAGRALLLMSHPSLLNCPAIALNSAGLCQLIADLRWALAQTEQLGE